MFVEQCRELDIAIAMSPKGAANIAQYMRKQAAAAAAQSTRPMASTSKPLSGPAGPAGSQAQFKQGLVSGLEKLGKNFNQIMQVGTAARCAVLHTDI